MVKGSPKEEKRKQKKAKRFEDYHDKNSERETLPKGLKRGLTSEDENCRLDDGKRDASNKERKKTKKDTGDNNAEDKCQHEGKQKERQDQRKSRERPQELANTESSELDSLRKKKRKKESRRNDSYEEEHNKREYSKGSRDKSLKELEPTLDVGKKRRKKKHDKNSSCDEHQIGDLENLSDKNNDDNETDNRKKKKKRKKEKELHYKLDTQSNEEVSAEMLDTGEVTGNEETSIEGKKKKKKSKQEPGEESRSAVHPAIDYLHTWYNNRKYWNFRKVRQVWLLKNMFNQEQISDENFNILLKYLEGLEGAAKDKTIEMAEQRLESGAGGSEQESMVESRVRQVLQLLTE